MTPEKVLQVIGKYQDTFLKKRIIKKKMSDVDFDQLLNLNSDRIKILRHCYYMLDEMEEFVREGRMEKCFRWLGFIQGVLLVSGLFTLNELKDHSRP